jgi:hypothetical protein
MVRLFISRWALAPVRTWYPLQTFEVALFRLRRAGERRMLWMGLRLAGQSRSRPRPYRVPGRTGERTEGKREEMTSLAGQSRSRPDKPDR